MYKATDGCWEVLNYVVEWNWITCRSLSLQVDIISDGEYVDSEGTTVIIIVTIIPS